MRCTTSLQSFFLVFSLVRVTVADCRSTGTDFIDGGGPYCVNTTSTDFFSFGTEFKGCQASDTQGGVVTPILIDPSNDEFFCSDIATNPDDKEMRSTCDVAGNEVRKNSMVSGTWIVVIEGLTFAWMRSFKINAAPPVTVTSTPVATFLVTSTPLVTSTSTSTAVITTTLPASTVIVPSTTLTKTVTITPNPVTSTTTNWFTLTNFEFAFSKTIKTVTVTKSCITKLGPWDPKCTIKPTKAKLAAASTTPKIRARYERDPTWARNMRREAEARGLLEGRSVDQCTATVIATTLLPSTTVTITAPVSTVVVPTQVTSTASVTPPPVTAVSGAASKTVTTTKPTRTITRTSLGITQITVTNTIWATLTTTIKVKPTGVTCIRL